MVMRMAKQEIRVTCKNVFLNAETGCDAAQLTQRWIEMINQIEKSKEKYVGAEQ